MYSGVWVAFAVHCSGRVMVVVFGTKLYDVMASPRRGLVHVELVVVSVEDVVVVWCLVVLVLLVVGPRVVELLEVVVLERSVDDEVYEEELEEDEALCKDCRGSAFVAAYLLVVSSTEGGRTRVGLDIGNEVCTGTGEAADEANMSVPRAVDGVIVEVILTYLTSGAVPYQHQLRLRLRRKCTNLLSIQPQRRMLQPRRQPHGSRP